jgi:hypothetical protein
MCCISNSVNETDDGMSWNGSEENGNCRGDCKEDERAQTVKMETSGTDWLRYNKYDTLCALSDDINCKE